MIDATAEAEYQERVEHLHGLVAAIVHGSDDPTTPARERVAYYRDHCPHEFPAWLEGNWYELLICEVECLEAGSLDEPDRSEWDGSDWRTDWLGYPRGERPVYCEEEV